MSDPAENVKEEKELSPEEAEKLRLEKAAKNKAKKARKKEKKRDEKEQEEQAQQSGTMTAERQRKLEQAMKVQSALMPKKKGQVDPQTKHHEFWDTQPVMQLDKPFDLNTDREEPLENRQKEDVRKEPYDLPDGMEWWEPDVSNDDDMKLVYELLRDHYVEDDDAMFRFNYTTEFLRWALLPPNFIKEWHIAIRSKTDSSVLVGFISGIPVKVAAGDNVISMCEINFLCVNKQCRANRLAPLLIKEVTRRVNLLGIWQAIYTAGILITSTIAQCQYWHRSLNPQKLIQIGFSRIPQSFEKFAKPLEQVKKHYALPDQPKIPGIRPMVKKDHKQVRVLLENYLKKFEVHLSFTNDEICHWFLPRKGVIDTYVVQNKDGQITDLCSFYTLPSTVIGATKHKIMSAAYSYYNVATSVEMTALVYDAMTLARKQDLDVYNALDIMDNTTILKDLKFGMGDGHLRYYFYNWKFPEIKPSSVGIVLL